MTPFMKSAWHFTNSENDTLPDWQTSYKYDLASGRGAWVVFGGKPILVAIDPGWLLQTKGLETLPPLPTYVII